MKPLAEGLQCAALPVGPLGARADRPGIDPALVWADATDFRDFRRPGQPRPHLLPVLAEWAGPNGQDVPETALLEASRLHDLLQNGSPAPGGRGRPPSGRRLHRLELQLPVVPQRPRPGSANTARPAPRSALPSVASAAPGVAQGPVLLGVIDCGCPFAHRMLRDAAGTGTRILRLWDQDPEAPAFAHLGARAPEGHDYGAEIGREGLNALMAAAASPSQPGWIDEARCYALAGYDDVLRWRFGHGAAVLGLALHGRSCEERLISGSVVPQADVVFVQIPRDAVQDSGSASLGRWVVDALNYIVSCAAPGQRVVINLSDGSSRGPHDGTSLIDRAMAGLVRAQRAAGGPGREVEIVVAAGNVHDEQRHAQFDALAPDRPGRVWLRVPPHAETPVVVTLRLPPGARGLRARATPPGARPGAWAAVGEALAWTAPGAAGPCAGLVMATPAPEAGPGLATVCLLTIAPTRTDTGAPVVAPAGDWCVEVALDPGCPPPAQPVHLWISRAQRNPTALPRSLQARFIDVDRRYDPQPHLRPLRDDPPLPPAERSPIRRAGTLNALAILPPEQGVIVAGAAFLRERMPTFYTSSGPAAGGRREGPDVAAPVDENLGLRSVRVCGNTSGQICRAAGSSFAAPQVARHRARPEADALRVRQAGPSPDPRRLGACILSAD